AAPELAAWVRSGQGSSTFASGSPPFVSCGARSGNLTSQPLCARREPRPSVSEGSQLPFVILDMLLHRLNLRRVVGRRLFELGTPGHSASGKFPRNIFRNISVRHMQPLRIHARYDIRTADTVAIDLSLRGP